MSADGLDISRDGGVVTVTLDRPEKRNAINIAMTDGLLALLDEVTRRDEDRVLVLTGAGETFSSGADLTEAHYFSSPLAYIRRVGSMVRAVHELPKPTIAALPGIAAGVSANLALACDLVIASEHAQICEVFASRALSLDGGGSWLLPRLVGLQRAKQIAFFADKISADDAERFGLVTWVVPAADLSDATREWAGRLGTAAPQALALIKSQLNASWERSFTEALEHEAICQVACMAHPDFTEGLTAFSEKRPPVFGVAL